MLSKSYKNSRYWARLALWVTIGVVLAGLEHLIPSPFPWLKLGLANGAALIVLYQMGFFPALMVNFLRILAISLLLGSWASPAFILSLCAGMTAIVIMGLLKAVFKEKIGIITVSVSGAWVHVLVQFGLAAILIVRHSGIFILAGPSLILAVVSGVIVGWLAYIIQNRLPATLLQNI